MEVSNTVLKLIVKECCRSLSYNDEERQFSFPLRPSLKFFWENHKSLFKGEVHDFTLSDFNTVLSNLEHLENTQIKISCSSMSDNEIENGEILEITTSDMIDPIKIIKMTRGQYLNIHMGSGLSLGDKFEFCVNKNIITSEGCDLGLCKSISLLLPNIYSIALGRIFLGKYYTNNIGESLWPIFDEAEEYIRLRDSQRLESILLKSSNLGIGAFALLNILKGVCAQIK